MTSNPNNILLALGLVCILGGLRAMFGSHNPVMGWLGLAIGVGCLGLLLWRYLRKEKAKP
jgi:hypothetical protein